MKHIGLFEGIGGFSLAAEWAGWETIAWCEINPFCQKVLSYHFPKAKQHHDIKTTDFTIYRGQCDILTGGFPCQPYSLAGKRKGKEDDRHLWPEMLRAVREIQPTWIVGENVFGLVNWDGGVVFNEVQTDLEAEGYEVQPYILPACAVNAPHRRDRVWFVAKNTRSNGCRNGEYEKQGGIWNEREFGARSEERDTTKKTTPNPDYNGQRRGNGENEVNTSKGGEYAQRKIEQMGGDAADTCISGRKKFNIPGFAKGQGYSSRCYNEIKRNWDNFPTQPPVRGKYDGVSESMVRNLKSEIYATISERYTDKDLQEVWEHFQSPEIREQIGGLYKIYDTGILFKVLQLCSPANTEQKGFSIFSEKASEGIMRKLQQHGTITNTPQGRELEKQFTQQFADTLPYLSHEIALVSMEAERATVSFNSWHRNESIKAYGNAIVPQVAYQIFKAINEMTNNSLTCITIQLAK